MVLNKHVLVLVLCLALATQSVMPVWAADQEFSESRVGKSVLKEQASFNNVVKLYMASPSFPKNGLLPSIVCRRDEFKNFRNCTELAAKKWLDLYFKDKDHSFFFVNLPKVSQEQDVVELLKQIGKMNIPLQHVAALKRELEKSAKEGILAGKEEVEDGKDRIFNPAWDTGILFDIPELDGVGKIILGAPLKAVGTAGLSFLAFSLPKLISNPKVPIVQIPQLTDAIASVLKQDLPQLKMLFLSGKAKVNLTQQVDLQHLTLRLNAYPEGITLDGLLQKMKIQRLNLSKVVFQEDNFVGIGQALANHTLQHLDMSETSLTKKGIKGLKSGLGSSKANIQTLVLQKAFLRPGYDTGKALGALLPTLESDLVDLSFNAFTPETIQGLAEGLGDKALTISKIKLVGALTKHTDNDMADYLAQLLPKLKSVDLLDLRGNNFDETLKQWILNIAKTNGMEKKVKL